MSSNETKEQPADITNLQESFSKQQKKISALKELVLKSEVAHGKSTSSAQEKVKSIAERLTLLKSKARSRQSLEVPQQDATTAGAEATEQTLSQSHISITSPSSSNFSTPNPTPLKPQNRSDSNMLMTANISPPTSGSEKILLLRQQMQQNKELLAKRASSKQHLEQMVTQLKEKFDSTQQCLEDTTELGRSMTNLSALVYTPVTRERHKSATDLSTQPFSLEKERIKFLENRCRLLEKQLEKEKQANINQEASLNECISSQASFKRIKELENNVLELEEALRVQQNVNTEETAEDNIKWTVELERLQKQIAEKNVEINSLRQKITERANENYDANELEVENERLRNEVAQHLTCVAELQTVNDMLEATRCGLTEKSEESEEELQQLQAELDTSKERLYNASLELELSEEKCASLQEDLNKLKEATEVITQDNATDSTDAQVKAEMAKQIQELQDELEALKAENLQLKATVSESEKLEVSDANIAERIADLEATIESQRQELDTRTETLRKQEEELMEKTIELNVLNANFKVLEDKLQTSSKNKPLFSSSAADEADNPELKAEIKQLKHKLDESNKAMIKLKLKNKQTEKQMEKERKGSDFGEVVKLEKANEELQQKIIELEDEKGQWQLTQMDDPKNTYSAEKLFDVTNSALEEQCKTQTETIRLLEQQKYEQSEKLEETQDELQTIKDQLNRQDHRETARVKSEMSEIHFEEKVEEQAQELRTLQSRLMTKETEIEELQQKQAELRIEKQAVDTKLERYISENIELLDKVEKLSKSSSSAESIEIVERLTQQERAEIDEFNKRLDQEHISEHAASSVSELTQTEMGPELNESLVNLREESSELMNKIELFTTERREVLEKMEHLTAENQDLLRKMEELTDQRDLMETNALLADNAKTKLETKLQEVTREKESLALQVTDYTVQKAKLSQELTSLQKSSEVVAAIDSADGVTLFDKCEKSLSKLNSELEAYRKANDKNAKFNASKKLAKEAKNAHTQLSELLQKVKEASTAVETVTVVETVVAVTAPNGKALAEYEQLTAQNRELKTTVDELRRDLLEARDTVSEPIVEIKEQPIKEQHEAVESELRLQKAIQDTYEEQCTELQSTVEGLRRELREALRTGEERFSEVTQLNEELTALRKLSVDFDLVMNDKEMSFEKQVEQLTRLRKELEGKCETYEGEMEILQTLVTEQKQQLIEAYKEGEHEMNMKLLDLQQRDEQIAQLRAEILQLKAASAAVGEKMTDDLRGECEKLREKLKINKTLVTEQINELANKQETIDILNQQLIELYKTMEENANKVIEKEDELASLQELIDTNNKEVESLRKDNNEQKAVVDKLLNELHSHRNSLPQLEAVVQSLGQTNKQLEQKNKELEQRNKQQLEKLKKYAINLKKRASQCQEFEVKIKEMERGALDELQTKEHIQREKVDLATMNANNLVLNERVKELELKLKETESSLQELHEVLQGKTMELLETMEHSAKVESELHEMQQSFEEKLKDIVQLKNALSASQDQESAWGDAASVTNDELLKELLDKSRAILQLEEDLKRAEDSHFEKLNEIAELRNKLTVVESQVSDWGADSFDNVNFEKLTKELTDKTACLEQAERDLSEVQAELLQMHESEKERQQAISELQEALHHKHELTAELEKQLAANMLDQQGDVQTMQERLQADERRLSEVKDELKAKSLKFEKSKAVIKERNNQIHRLQAQLKDLQDKLIAQPEGEPLELVLSAVQSNMSSALPPKTALLQVANTEYDALQKAHEKLSEQYSTDKSNFQATIARLETLHDGIHAKLQEDLAYIETLEQENTKYKENICKLEECVGVFEERRASMERRANLLDEQLQSRANEYEKSEDELIYRLNMLSEHDDVIGRRLLESQEEKEELLERLDRLQIEYNDLNAKYVKLQKDYETYKEDIHSNLETEKLTLRQQLTAAELELQHIRSVYDAKLAAKTTEIDDLECELSDQLEKINAEKRNLSEDLERTRDECTVQKDEIVRANESLNAVEQAKQELEREATWLRMQSESAQQDQYELQELRMQTLQDKTEIDNVRHQIDTLATNHEIELQALRTQISELDTLRMQVGQNQTDDQVFIETENKRLTDLLAEKEAVIENYQRQNLQLQMAAVAATQPQSSQNQIDPFALVFNMPSTTPTLQINNQTQQEECSRFEHQLAEKTELIARLQSDCDSLQSEFHSLRESNAELQRQLADQGRELECLHCASTRYPSAGPAEISADVIPAPPMFFASEQMMPSPFDELVQVRTMDRLEGTALSRQQRDIDNNVNNSGEQQTIEDLQRNVSDLEKHAQDLENKLAMRNQYEGEYEERLRELENCVRTREQQLQKSQLELQALEQQNIIQQQTQKAVEQQMNHKNNKLENLEQQLQERDQRLIDIQAKLQQQTIQVEQFQTSAISVTRMDAFSSMQELQHNFEHLQRVLEERDQELQQLRRTLDAEKQLKDTVHVLESQIITEPVVKTSTADAEVKPTLDMFFGSSTATDFENLSIPHNSNIPVVEEEIVPKKAYLCYPTDEIAQSIPNRNAMLDLGVDWGDSWSTNEAAAEAVHFSNTQAAGVIGRQSLVPREQQLEIQLQEAAESVQELQLALERAEQQKQELQVKSGKMVKKLKEFKAKIDELQASVTAQVFRKSTSVEPNLMFSELDAAIQEELKEQVKSLEMKLEELHKLQESSGAEKEKLLKRIDVLTAGNERMSEMKERQDMDVQMYQLRIRELQEKLSRLDDWGTDSANAEMVPVVQNVTTALSYATEIRKHTVESLEVAQQQQQQIAELKAEIQDINGDRQELQDLLEEEKANAARSDENIKTLLKKIAVLDNAAEASETFEKSKYNELKLAHQNLSEMHINLKDTNDNLKKELHSLQTEHAQQLQTFHEQEISLKNALQQAESKIEELQAEIKKLRKEMNNTEENYTDSQLQALELRARNYELSEAKKELETDVEAKEVKSNLEAQLESICMENEELRIERDVMAKEISNLEAEINRLQSTQEAESIIEEQQSEIKKLRKEVTSGDESYTDCQLQAFDLRTRNFELAEANRELEAENVADDTSQSNLKLTLEAMSREISRLREEKQLLTQQICVPTTIAHTSSDEFSTQLQEKEAEIVHLKQRVEDVMREDQTEKLVLEILSKNQEIHMLKMQVQHLEDDKQELAHNLTLQISKELQAPGKQEAQAQNVELQQHVQKLEVQLRELQDEKALMEQELQVLNNHVLQSLQQEDNMKATVLELDTKNIEISELRKSLAAFKGSSSIGGDGNGAQADVSALNAQWEAIVEQKCGEIAQLWRVHLEQREVEFKQVEARLQQQVVDLQQAANAAADASSTLPIQQQAVASAETTATSTPASVSTSASASSSAAPSKDGTPLRARFNSETNEAHEAAADAIIEKMQAALESQEMEIVTLKEQLAIRSAEYARLAAQYDPFKLQTTLSHSGMSVVSGPVSLDSSQTKRSTPNIDASVVPKSELDLALYMLHQRDMRLEEMTVELLSLLEERDTLQLKLSNSLRQLEDIRAQAGYVDSFSTQSNVTTSAVGAKQNSILDSPSKALVAGTTTGNSTVELNQKLSQLQTVNHSKDKIIKEERDQRIRQMERIQQDVAKMPSAAVYELVGSDLSQSSQSPSSVLLNWLWGNKPQIPPTGGAPPN